MGYSITAEKHQKIEALRREGRLCQTNNGRGGCSARATVQQTVEDWNYRVGEGESTVRTMVHCARHARRFPAGFRGVNFVVLSVQPLPRTSRS